MSQATDSGRDCPGTRGNSDVYQCGCFQGLPSDLSHKEGKFADNI